jgi:phospholipid transport system substrate-binding protein
MYSRGLRCLFFVSIFALSTLVLPVMPLRAAGENLDPAASQIESFYAALLETMKQGKELGIEGRYKKLAPVIEETFDLPAMTAIAVGPTWPSIPADKQTALVDAFRHMTIATYARNFNSYNGELFEVEPKVETRNANRIVRTRLIQKGKEPVSLSYLMHQTGSAWKVIDVYYMGAISQLAARRSEFSATLKTGGPDALQQKLRELGDRLMTGT